MPISLLRFSALAFVPLFTMANPLGVVPVYNAMTAALDPGQSRRVALRATLTAFLVMVLFALGGLAMICGPGTITTAVLPMNESGDLAHRVVLFAAMTAVSALTYAFLVSGKRVVAALGPSGNKVLTRLMGLIAMVIAVEFSLAGPTPIVRWMAAAGGTPPAP